MCMFNTEPGTQYVFATAVTVFMVLTPKLPRPMQLTQKHYFISTSLLISPKKNAEELDVPLLRTEQTSAKNLFSVPGAQAKHWPLHSLLPSNPELIHKTLH